MNPATPRTGEPLRWEEALRWILTGLCGGTPGRELDPSPEELETLRLAGFGPLLAEQLEGHPAFPALFAEQVLNGRRVGSFQGALIDLLHRMEARISAPIVFKGLAACDELYARPALRVFTDIDLLIPRRDLPAWDETIRSAGGRCTDHLVFPGRRFSARRYFQHAYSLPARDDAPRVDLDLHLSFGPPQQYPVDYDRAAPACRRSEKGPYLLLNADQWTYALAIHQVRTLFVWSYQDYVDLFQIVRRSPPDGERLIATARQAGALKATSILLRNLQKILPAEAGVRLPSLERFLPAGHAEFEEQLRLPVAHRPGGEASFLHSARRTARLADSLPGLLRYAAAYAAKRGMDLVAG